MTQIFIPGALVTSRDGFVGTVIEQSRRGSVLCQWLNSVADDDLSHLRGFAAADLVSCGGVSGSIAASGRSLPAAAAPLPRGRQCGTCGAGRPHVPVRRRQALRIGRHRRSPGRWHEYEIRAAGRVFSFPRPAVRRSRAPLIWCYWRRMGGACRTDRTPAVASAVRPPALRGQQKKAPRYRR